MPTYGITTTGFVIKTLDEIKAELEAEYRGVFGSSIDLSPETVPGEEIGIAAERESLIWELAQSVYDSQFVATASGASLVGASANTGTVPEEATFGEVDVTCNLNAGTVLAIGKKVAVVGDPTNTWTSITVGTGPGPGAQPVTVRFRADNAGPVPAFSGTLTQIVTPVAGWNSATNPLDASQGQAADTDTTLRARQQAELTQQGSTSVAAIRADILANLPEVITVTGYENVGNFVDVNGLPPGAIEMVVYGPAAPSAAQDLAVADQIVRSKSGGIGTSGNVTKTPVDDSGQTIEIKFTRPTNITAWVRATVAYLIGPEFPGLNGIKAAVLALNPLPGEDMDAGRVKAKYYVANVLSVTSFETSLDGVSWGTANFVANPRQRVAFDSSRIAATLVPLASRP